MRVRAIVSMRVRVRAMVSVRVKTVVNMRVRVRASISSERELYLILSLF